MDTCISGCRGDVNDSGTVDIIDAIMIAQYYAGLNPPGFTGSEIPTPATVSSDYPAPQQETGTNDPDIVQTDGEYTYAIYGYDLVICLAYPNEKAAVVNTITFDKAEISPREILVNGNILVVTGNCQYTRMFPDEAQLPITTYSHYMSKAIFFDITDRTNIGQQRSFTLDGRYV